MLPHNKNTTPEHFTLDFPEERFIPVPHKDERPKRSALASPLREKKHHNSTFSPESKARLLKRIPEETLIKTKENNSEIFSTHDLDTQDEITEKTFDHVQIDYKANTEIEKLAEKHFPTDLSGRKMAATIIRKAFFCRSKDFPKRFMPESEMEHLTEEEENALLQEVTKKATEHLENISLPKIIQTLHDTIEKYYLPESLLALLFEKYVASQTILTSTAANALPDCKNESAFLEFAYGGIFDHRVKDLQGDFSLVTTMIMNNRPPACPWWMVYEVLWKTSVINLLKKKGKLDNKNEEKEPTISAISNDERNSQNQQYIIERFSQLKKLSTSEKKKLEKQLLKDLISAADQLKNTTTKTYFKLRYFKLNQKNEIISFKSLDDLKESIHALKTTLQKEDIIHETRQHATLILKQAELIAKDTQSIETALDAILVVNTTARRINEDQLQPLYHLMQYNNSGALSPSSFSSREHYANLKKITGASALVASLLTASIGLLLTLLKVIINPKGYCAYIATLALSLTALLLGAYLYFKGKRELREIEQEMLHNIKTHFSRDLNILFPQMKENKKKEFIDLEQGNTFSGNPLTQPLLG